ncbi:MAG: outer membrane beta-barrel protein [Bernardetiaceae bacterium]|nr:outer membrane beta-barrel protein [Bernardetiaceae bacterium]
MIKRIVLFIFVSCIFVAQSYAQRDYSIDSRGIGGIKAGMNLTGMMGADAVAYQNLKIGMHAGMFFNYQVGKIVAFRADLLYSQMGYVQRPNTFQRYTSNFDYISFSPQISFNFTPNKINRFAMNLGPVISVPIRANAIVANIVVPEPTIDDAIDAGAGDENQDAGAVVERLMTPIAKSTREVNQLNEHALPNFGAQINFSYMLLVGDEFWLGFEAGAFMGFGSIYKSRDRQIPNVVMNEEGDEEIVFTTETFSPQVVNYGFQAGLVIGFGFSPRYTKKIW